MQALEEIFAETHIAEDGTIIDLLTGHGISTDESSSEVTKSINSESGFKKAENVMTHFIDSIDNMITASMMFKRMQEGKPLATIAEDEDMELPDDTPRDWMWVDLPEDITTLLTNWKRKFVKAMPGAEEVEHMHVTLFHEITNLPADLGQMVSTIANAAPAEATLGTLKAFRTENHGVAIAIEVSSFQLRDLRHKLQGEIEHTPSIHIYTPHITLAYIPDCEGTAIEGLELFGIKGQQFVIETINVGTQDSYHPCALLGANSEWISRFEPTTVKSMGMSTLTAESGGLLMQDEKNIDVPENEDDDDEQWIKRSQEMADSLDDMFGGF